MRKIILFLTLFQISLIQYGQIIADHKIVSDFDKIPQYYIDLVKKMLVVVAGESHSVAYIVGLNLLETLNATYQVNSIASGTPEAYTTSHLRISRATWGDYSNSSGWIYDYGEEDWFTNATAIARTKASITYCNTNSLTISAFGFGWCYDPYAGGLSSLIDPVYNVHWFGRSEGGPNGSRSWGIDAGDNALTGNSISMDTYLAATQAYIDYCIANGYTTKVFFTTGPVDNLSGAYGTEELYQAFLKYEHIRNYVAADATRILFDYADILCYDDNGTPTTATWSGHTFPAITAANGTPIEGAHISFAGALRLGKAMWWMLARIAGWDGITNTVPVTGITITGAGGSTQITTNGGTLQLSAAVTPDNATNKTVTWSVTNETGQATINSAGLVTAVTNGTVTARATANDGSGVYGTLAITISNQVIAVTGITVTGAGGATKITTDNGTLQLSAAIIPDNATNKTVTWLVTNGTGQATINSTGLVTAIANGTVTASATANDGSGVYGTLLITITNQVIPVKGITVTGSKGITSITTNHGTLELSATISPSNATNQTVSWSIINGTGQASISSSGLVTAIADGTVTASAKANDGSGVYGTLVIAISNQVILVTSITVTGENGATTITTENGTLQLSTTITPVNTTNLEVTWSIINNTGQAFISADGLVTAIASGTVTAQATVNDGSGITGTMDITITKRNITEPMVVIVDQNEMKFPLDERYLNCKISLYDLNGNLMRARLVDSNICLFDISGFHSGLYIAVLSNNMILKVAKIILP